MSTFTSPVPSNLDIAGLPPPPAGGPPATIVQGLMPDVMTAIIPANGLYDAGANPLIVSPIIPGILIFIANNEAVSILVKGPTVGDPGVVVPAGATTLLGFDAVNDFLFDIGGTAGGVVTFAAVQAALAGATGPVSFNGQMIPGALIDDANVFTTPPVAVGELSTLVERSGPLNRRVPALIMICGDSWPTGGDSAMSDLALSVRGMLWDAIRRVRGNVRFLGSNVVGLFDNRPAVPGSNEPGNVRLGDWHTNSVGGTTIAQAAAAALVTEAAQGLADVYLLWSGRNDIAARITAGDTPAQAAAFVLAAFVAFVAARPLSRTTLVCDLGPVAPPYGGNIASENAAAALINAGLPAALAAFANARVVQVGSLLAAGHTDGTTGNHLGAQGLARAAEAISDAVIRVIGISGLESPRDVTMRVPVPRVVIPNDFPANINAFDNGTLGLLPIGLVSFSFGFIYRPRLGDLNAAYSRALMHFGPDLTPSGVPDGSGLWLRAGPEVAGDGNRSLQLYIGGVASYVPNDALREGTSHAIMVVIDQIMHEARIYCLREGRDGRALTSLLSVFPGLPAFTAVPGLLMMGGRNAGAGQFGAQGLFGDLWLANGRIATVDDVEAFYYEKALPQGTTAYYALKDGAGAVAAVWPAYAGSTLPSLTIVGGAWSAAAALREPWHRGVDQGDSIRQGFVTLNGTTPVVVPYRDLKGDEFPKMTRLTNPGAGQPGIPFAGVTPGVGLSFVSNIVTDNSIWYWEL